MKQGRLRRADRDYRFLPADASYIDGVSLDVNGGLYMA
jgi:hypothetical protein